MGTLFEQLAAIEHARWAHWQRYMHSKCIHNPDGSLAIPAALVARWEGQIATTYAELSEKEKQSDRDQVDEYWPLIQAELDTLAAEVERLQSAMPADKSHLFYDLKNEQTHRRQQFDRANHLAADCDRLAAELATIKAEMPGLLDHYLWFLEQEPFASAHMIAAARAWAARLRGEG